MEKYKIIEIKKSIYEDNNVRGELLRQELKKNHTFLLNVMSSPGSGKTTTLVSAIDHLKDKYRIGVLEADIDSDVDAQTISKTGTKVIQLHTGGMCHLDAEMTRQGLESMGYADLDLVILENVGNLICTAGYDVGAAKNIMILSVPEGDDKPLKYPKMFSICDALIVNKIDVLPYFDFNVQLLEERVRKLNPNIKIFFISALKNQGVKDFTDWLDGSVKEWAHE